MSFTAIAAMIVTPGETLGAWPTLVLALTVLVAAASAGAFNQYYELDIDSRMRRTRNRPFLNGTFTHSPFWLFVITGMLVAGVSGAALVLNGMAAVYIFLGAFFYAVVYTVWLKRRTWLNIVIGGASGSFAVLAGAAAVDPALSPIPVLLALVLFFWTPSHFWSLAIAQREDYAAAGVPMLPVLVGNDRAARVVLANTLVLVGASVLPFFFGMGWIYLAGALAGGGFFIYRNLIMAGDPTRRNAMLCFLASLVQLSVLLVGAVADALLIG
jgi:protoheme IX farnesyltransferase